MEFLILLALVALNGVFAMSELALVSSRKARLKARAQGGDAGARAALKLHEDPSSFLSTVQIGITLVGVISGAYGATALADDLAPAITRYAPQLADRADEIAFAVVIVLTTYLSLVVGELAPKRLALLAPEAIASAVARPMSLLSKAAFPAVWALRASTNGLLRLTGLSNTKTAGVTEEEIQSLIEEGAASGAIEADERVMMRGVMRLADRDVRSIMTPRPDVVWVDAEKPLEAQLEMMRGSGHSRFPLARGDLEQIVGIIQTKDLVGRGLDDPVDLAALARPATYVPESLSVLALLDALQKGDVRMAVIVDELGVVQGLVTPTDLLSAIAGARAYGPGDGVTQPVRREDGSWLIDGLTPLEDLAMLMGVSGFEAAEGDYATVAGLVLHTLQRLPNTGDEVRVNGVVFEVVDMDGRRVDKILVRPAPEA